MEERIHMAQDHTHLAMQRAISVEVDLLQLRVENVKRPGEARLMEIDRIWWGQSQYHLHDPAWKI